MHVDEVLCHGENGGTTWETSHRDCIMRKVVGKEVIAGGRFDFFLDSFKITSEQNAATQQSYYQRPESQLGKSFLHRLWKTLSYRKRLASTQATQTLTFFSLSASAPDGQQ